MTNLSPATEVAWQVAASEALQQGAKWIEPHHLLIGVCSVGKLLRQPGSLRQSVSEQNRVQIELDVENLADTMAEVGVDIRLLRRSLRTFAGLSLAGDHNETAAKMPRSMASQEVFMRAKAIASSYYSDRLELFHLCAALLDLPEEKIDSAFEMLGKRKEQLRLALLGKAKGQLQSYAEPEKQAPIEITQSMDASVSVYPIESTTENREFRSALLYELPLLFGSSRDLTDLLQETVRRIQLVIPAVSHAALLIRERVTDELLLLAHVPSGTPLVSKTLARRVMKSRKACIWVRGQGDGTVTLHEYGIHSGICAPLVWQDEVLGVFLLNSQDPVSVLCSDDLRLIVALAHHAAMALAGAQLQNDLRRKGEILERMLTNFSPKTRNALLDRASRGDLRLGGEKSEVTVLCSDVRGFTKMCEKLTTDQIVELLNDYLSGLVDAIFEHDGSVDKFLGDGILAIFGSPEQDSAQHLKALRAAIAMQGVMKKRNEERNARGLTTCEIGIGVHCGEVFHGFIGTPDRMEFTVIGDTVNRTVRLCAAAKGGEILLSPYLFQRAWNFAEVEPTRIGTKHEGDCDAYRLKSVRNV